MHPGFGVGPGFTGLDGSGRSPWQQQAGDRKVPPGMRSGAAGEWGVSGERRLDRGPGSRRWWMVVTLTVVISAVSVGVAPATSPPWPSSNPAIGHTDDWDFDVTSTESSDVGYCDCVGTVIAGTNIRGTARISLRGTRVAATAVGGTSAGSRLSSRTMRSAPSPIAGHGGPTRSAIAIGYGSPRISWPARRTPPYPQRPDTACRETGDAAGFGDGGDTGRSCMDGGDNAGTSWCERNMVDARY